MDENKILIRLPAEVWEDKDSGAYVSHIPKLGLWSAGNDENEAVKAMESAVNLYLSVAAKKGTLVNVLLDSGILDTGEKKRAADSCIGNRRNGQGYPTEHQSYQYATGGEPEPLMPAEAPIPPGDLKKLLELDGFTVEDEDEYNWALFKEGQINPVIIPKRPKTIPLDVMMGALNKAEMSPGRFRELLAHIESQER